jgi:hypothetical protein
MPLTYVKHQHQLSREVLFTMDNVKTFILPIRRLMPMLLLISNNEKEHMNVSSLGQNLRTHKCGLISQGKCYRYIQEQMCKRADENVL